MPQDLTLAQKISIALKDHPEAIALFMMLRDVLHFWDDLIDGDQVISHGDINRSMFKALVAIPANRFYQQHSDRLHPILTNAIANWMTANEFEKTGDANKLQLAFVIRSDYANLLIQMAYLIGGYDWMVQVTPLIRAMWTKENFSAYLSNLQRERASRNGMSAELIKSWYEQETPEYLSHGLTVFNAAMLGPTEEAHVDTLLEWIGPPKGATVVDMGCGVGGVSRLMAARDPSAKFYGVTNVQAQIDAMNSMGGVIPLMADYHQVPLDDGVADVVMFNESIGYGDLNALLRESFRLLRHGGKLAIKDVAGLTGCAVWSEVWQWRVHPKGLIDRLATEQGFKVISSHDYGCDMGRYRDFIETNQVMKDRYGALDVPENEVQPWFWLLKKDGDEHA